VPWPIGLAFRHHTSVPLVSLLLSVVEMVQVLGMTLWRALEPVVELVPMSAAVQLLVEHNFRKSECKPLLSPIKEPAFFSLFNPLAFQWIKIPLSKTKRAPATAIDSDSSALTSQP
jgi:hypothetical protein